MPEINFHNRLSLAERKLSLLQTVPTLPIYDINNFPDDSLECQLAIGSDDNLYWYSNGFWRSMYTNNFSVDVNNVPDDILEGQLVVCRDGSGIAWYSSGEWHGMKGRLAIGDYPDDSLDGQIAIGSKDNICWHINGQWWTIGNPFLAVWFDRSTGNPALFLQFPLVNTAWLRFTWRREVPHDMLASSFMIGLINTSSIVDIVTEAGYLTYPLIDSNMEIVPNLCLGNTNGIGSAWGASPINADNSLYSRSVYPKYDLGTIIDFGCEYLGEGDGSGTGSDPPYAKWRLRIYADDVLEYDAIWGANGRFRDMEGNFIYPNPLPLDRVSGIWIPSHYGDYTDSLHYSLDDIQVGSSKGGNDIVDTITFSDGTYSPFLLSGDDVYMGPTFEVIPFPIPRIPYPQEHPVRTISGSSGSYDDNNSSVTVEPYGQYWHNGIFYEWIAPTDGTVTVTTDNFDDYLTDMYDPELYVFDTIPNYATDNSIAYNDDDHVPLGGGNAYYPLVTFSAVAGVKYYFLLRSHHWNDPGAYKISWSYE